MCFSSVTKKLLCFVYILHLKLFKKLALRVLLISYRKKHIDQSTFFTDFTVLLDWSNCTSLTILTQVTLKDILE